MLIGVWAKCNEFPTPKDNGRELLEDEGPESDHPDDPGEDAPAYAEDVEVQELKVDGSNLILANVSHGRIPNGSGNCPAGTCYTYCICV